MKNRNLIIEEIRRIHEMMGINPKKLLLSEAYVKPKGIDVSFSPAARAVAEAEVVNWGRNILGLTKKNGDSFSFNELAETGKKLAKKNGLDITDNLEAIYYLSKRSGVYNFENLMDKLANAVKKNLDLEIETKITSVNSQVLKDKMATFITGIQGKEIPVENVDAAIAILTNLKKNIENITDDVKVTDTVKKEINDMLDNQIATLGLKKETGDTSLNNVDDIKLRDAAEEVDNAPKILTKEQEWEVIRGELESGGVKNVNELEKVLPKVKQNFMEGLIDLPTVKKQVSDYIDKLKKDSTDLNLSDVERNEAKAKLKRIEGNVKKFLGITIDTSKGAAQWVSDIFEKLGVVRPNGTTNWGRVFFYTFIIGGLIAEDELAVVYDAYWDKTLGCLRQIDGFTAAVTDTTWFSSARGAIQSFIASEYPDNQVCYGIGQDGESLPEGQRIKIFEYPIETEDPWLGTPSYLLKVKHYDNCVDQIYITNVDGNYVIKFKNNYKFCGGNPGVKGTQNENEAKAVEAELLKKKEGSVEKEKESELEKEKGTVVTDDNKTIDAIKAFWASQSDPLTNVESLGNNKYKITFKSDGSSLSGTWDGNTFK